MLVLTRRKNETIEIDGGIVIHLIGIRGTKVQIGVEAPEGTRIHRGEVAEDRRRKPEATV